MADISARMTLRRMRFPYPENLKAWWNPKRPEFSHIVNAASLAMPYLEPYIIDTMRKAKERIKDPQLLADIDQFIAQESTHFRQHQQFNKRIAELGYKSVAKMEGVLKDDYGEFADTRPLLFNVAYAEGFEAMGLTVGNMLVEEREHLLAGADPAVASLILWHFAEEIEHKTVAYDVFKALDGRYRWRVYGFFYATVHIFFRTWQGYRALLIEDGRWYNLASRLAIYRLHARMFARMLPRLFRVLLPNYNPRQVEDPAWVKEWWRLHREGVEGLGELDTTRLGAPAPIPAQVRRAA